MGVKKKQIVRWHDTFTNRVTDWIITLLMLSVIFNLWPRDWPSAPLPPFMLLPYEFFSATNNHPSTPKINTIQPPTTNLVTTTLNLLASLFWFKFFWGFSTLSKQIYLFIYLLKLIFKMLFFFAYFCSIYIFCLGVYLFYSFFSHKFVVWIYDLYILGFILDFVKLYLFVN